MPRIRQGKAGRPVEYSRELPVYPTMEACSAATGVPISVLRIAKKNGCHAFTSGRIHFSEFVKWWFNTKPKAAEGEESNESSEYWGKRDKRATALMKEAKLQEQYERVIDFNLARSFIEHLLGALVFAEFDRYAQEFPATLKGKDEVGIRAECDKQKEMSKKNAELAVKAWIAKKGKTQ